VKVDADGTVHVPEVHMGVDCGFPANPERIESQMQGAAVQGMTVALNSGITFKNGRAEQSNYDNYDVVRIDNYPQDVYVHVVPHKFETHATGVGRRRRTGCAADCTSDRQRHLQRHRQAHPPYSDPS